MLNQHPITPPPELVAQWFLSAKAMPVDQWVTDVATKAAQWGADQQLEATDTWIRTEMKDRQRPVNRIADDHRADMRPKPPSLKEQALNDLDDIPTHDDEGRQVVDLSNIRRALEALPND
jgi:hypothetical protein